MKDNLQNYGHEAATKPALALSHLMVTGIVSLALRYLANVWQKFQRS